MSQINECDYCLAAHSMMAQGIGLGKADVLDARHGKASDSRTDAILKFAAKLVVDRGHAADSDVDGLRTAGLTDGEIGEVIANVALNIFTNYFNHVADTEVDFPAAEPLAEESAALLTN